MSGEKHELLEEAVGELIAQNQDLKGDNRELLAKLDKQSKAHSQLLRTREAAARKIATLLKRLRALER